MHEENSPASASQDGADTHNEQAGTVSGPVVQAGSIQGGVYLQGSAPQRVVPRQLPGAVRNFTGRVSELATLTTMLAESAGTGGTVVISATDPTTGMGKTALALYWAHQVAHLFPDGQLYVNLRGTDPSVPPLTLEEVIRGFLDAFAVKRVPRGLDAQVALYRSLLADKRVLVVLDNVRDVEQVRPLLPGSRTCVTLVTSRGPLTGLVAEGARSLPVDVLTVDEAHELLARHLGLERLVLEPQAVDELVELCARLPLALSIVAAHAAAQPGLTLADLVIQLRAERARLGTTDGGDLATKARTVFSWSQRRQTASAAQPDESETPAADQAAWHWPDATKFDAAGLAWARKPKALMVAGVAVAGTTLATAAGEISASTVLGVGYVLIRFWLLFAAIVLTGRSNRRRVVAAGIAAATDVFFLTDAVGWLHSSASVWAWLEFFAVLLFTGLLAIRFWPFTAVPRRLPFVSPTRRPLAYVSLAAAAAQFLLLFVAFDTSLGTMTIVDSVGAPAALLAVVPIAGLCVAVALTDMTEASQRTFVGTAIVAYLGPELYFMLGSLLLGPHFTYLGDDAYSINAAAAPFVLAQAAVTAALLTSTLLLLRRAKPLPPTPPAA